jgi:hypothetical protein
MPASRRKEERMWRLANELTNSGQYSGWYEIEVELRSQGFPRARSLLDNERIRERLDRACAAARKAP